MTNTETEYSVENSDTTRLWPSWVLLAIGVFVVYAVTAARGPQWQDSGYHILRIIDGDLVHPLGLALSHPLHFWMGRLAITVIPLEPCMAITLISSLAGAVAVSNVFGCVRTLTANTSAALLAGLTLAVAHTFWQLSTLTETYTLTAALLSGECWCLALYVVTRKRHYLWGACLLNGLGLANHLFALLTAPVLAFVIVYSLWKKSFRIGDVLVSALLWLVGSLPYTGLMVLEMTKAKDIGAVIRSALFGYGFDDAVLNTHLSARLLLIALAFILLSFPNFQLLSAAYGIARGSVSGAGKLALRAFLAGLIIHAVFALRYSVVDQHMFFLPLYVLLSLLAGVGYATFLKRLTPMMRGKAVRLGCALIVITVLFYAFLPSIARKFDVLHGVAHNKPYRDDYVYLFTPWSVAERSAEKMSDHAVELAGSNGLIIVEDRMAEFAVAYLVKRRDQTNVEVTRDVVTERITAMLHAGGAVVLVPRDADNPRTDPPIGAWRRDGDLYVLSTNAR